MIDWLTAGDPAIRWQTMRDLLSRPARVWEAERRKAAKTGWGAQLLAFQEPGGGWGGGVYSPKWISTTYTLLLLRDLGLPGTHLAARRGAGLMLDELLGPAGSETFLERLHRCDLCVVGMALSVASYFGVEDARKALLVEHLLQYQLADGGWNCRYKLSGRGRHSSFHTTFNVLDGLRDHIEAHATVHHRAALGAAEGRALEFMLAHRMFRSDKSGEVINANFLRFSFPTRWYYDVLRGLDYFRRIDARRDPRLVDAIGLLSKKQRKDGTWPMQNRHTGRVFFDMETPGRPSRWNTLRALRVLRWWAMS